MDRPGAWPWLYRRAPEVLLVATMAAATWPRLAPIRGLDYDYDEGVYWASLDAMRSGHQLFTEVYSSQPPLFLTGLLPFYSVAGGGIVAARLPIVALSLIGLVVAYLLGRTLAGPWGGLLGALLLAFAPPYLRLSYVLQGDLASVVLGMVALVVAVELGWRNARAPAWSVVGLLLAAAVLTKFLAAAYVVPICLVAAGLSWRATAARLFAVVVGTVAGTALVLAPFVGSLDLVYRQTVELHLLSGGAAPQQLAEKVKIVQQAAPPLPIAGLALVGAVAGLLVRRRATLIVLAWLAAAIAVVLGQRPLWAHHVVVLVPPLCLLAGAAVPLLVELASRSRQEGRAMLMWARPAGVAAGAILAAVTLVIGVTALPADDFAATRKAIAAIRAAVPGDGVIASDNFFAAAETGHEVPPQLVDMSSVRFQAHQLSVAEWEAAVESSHAVALVFGTPGYLQTPGLTTWVPERFRRVESPSADEEVWVRK